ncbi:MAG: prepilin-type N-terminal cleavage/methylation domain-containing protein [Burkholderiales bacterium]|nr:prepilin-type N-terminal cleavage/methylation domain-containing protein [Burkholderiales bacterium]
MSRLNVSPRPGGVTLLELLVVVAISAVLAAMAAPSMYEWMISQRVKSNAAELLTDIQFTRSEGMTRNRDMQITFRSDASQSCYTIHTTVGGGDCNCLSSTPCVAPGFKEVKTNSVPKSSHVSLAANPEATYFKTQDAFAGANATVITVSGLANQTLQVGISAVTRRPSICAPAGSVMKGYPACT